MSSNAERLPDLFRQQEQVNEEQRYPVTAQIFGHDGTTGSIAIPSFDGGNHRFPVDYNHTALPDDTTVLVVRDENDTYWVLAP